MAAAALPAKNKNPSDADIDENVCRCGSYVRIHEAFKSAAAKM
jgi:isoquinoline 1-oxidoreductase subunit alpha